MQYGYGAPSFGPYGGFQGAGFPGFGPPPPMPHGMGYQQPYGAPRQIGGSPRPSYKSGMLMHSPRQPPQAIQGGIPNTSNQPQPSQPLPALVTEHSPRFPGAYYSSMGGTGGHGDGDAAHAVYGSYQGPSYQHQPYQPKPYQAQPYPEPTNLFTFKTPGSLYTSQMPPSMAAGYEHAQSSGTVQVIVHFSEH